MTKSGGSQAIISSLEKIAVVIDQARKQRYYDDVKSMRDEILTALQHFFLTSSLKKHVFCN